MGKRDKKKWKIDYSRTIPLLIILLTIPIIIGLIINYNKSEETSAPYKNTLHEEILNNIKEATSQNEILDVPAEDPIDKEGTNETKEEEKNNNTNSKDIKYYIKVNNAQNVVTVYSKDSNGNYTVPVKAMVCSTGTATPTSGVYTTSDKYKWGTLIGKVYGRYCTRIVKSILFHSVPYTTEYDNNSLEYWEYDKLGTSASAGCVRLTVADAQWIFNNCVAGTKVEFYSDSNPGPLGKPTAKKISSETSVRGWDPTDPDPNNPWKTYKKEEPKKEEPVKNDDKENKIENTITNVIDPTQNQISENEISQNKVSNETENNIVENEIIFHETEEDDEFNII